MTKKDIKQVIILLLFGLINIIISFTITNMLGISNVVLFTTITAIGGDITWEVIIFIVLLLIEAIIYGIYSGELKELFEDEY